MTIGEKIVELRKKEKLTQEGLASIVGVSRQTLSNWESNITSPDLNQASILAKAFKVSLNDLVDTSTDVECSNNSSILTKLIGKKCTMDFDTEDYRISFDTVVEILDVSNEFIKISFTYKKKKIIKLIDINLVDSIMIKEDI